MFDKSAPPRPRDLPAALAGGDPQGSADAGRTGGAAGVAPTASFTVGELVRHRLFPFRGVIYDIDPEFANTEEWWQAIPEAIRPRKDQPFYHLLAENDEAAYVAYVSQQNLVRDETGEPVQHPAALQIFEPFSGGRYVLRQRHIH